MDIYWVEQSLSDVPVHNGWLAKGELTHLERFRIPKRRDDWRLGRWTAKRAVATVLQFPQGDATLQRIEILADASGAPRAYIDHQPAAVSISLSHRDGIASCALAQSTIPLGCDLELIESRSNAFVVDYFTDDEQANIAQQSADHRDRFVTALWSAKESTLKVLRTGLRADTRSVNIRLGAYYSKSCEQCDDRKSDPLSATCSPDEWSPFRANYQNQVLHGWWNTSASLIRTFAAAQPTNPPTHLEVALFDYSPCTP